MRTAAEPSRQYTARVFPGQEGRRAAVLIALWGIAITSGCGRTEGVQRGEPVALHAHPGDCRQCHGTFPIGGPRSAPPPKTCAASGCHRSLDTNPRLVHGPVAVGDCLACHLPHSSAAPHLVASPAPGLCTACHDRLYTCPAAGALATSDCAACHEPHGGERNFLRATSASGVAAR